MENKKTNKKKTDTIYSANDKSIELQKDLFD